MIQLTEVSKEYQESSASRTILNLVSLEIEAGEFVSITGPSGSGKSTLLNLVGGIDRADSGRITVAGQSLERLSEHELALFRRQHVGFVFQFFHLIPTLSVKENIQLPLALLGVDSGEKHLRDWLGRVGLSGRMDAYPDVLSGGEQQRVAIVRAAIHRPSLILADEPTGNLDQQAGEDILALLSDLSDSGTAVMMATHSRQAASVAGRNLTIADRQLKDGIGSSWD